MLFSLSDKNWQIIAKEAGLGEVLSINRITNVKNIAEFDTLGLASKTVELKTKHPTRSKTDSYTFNLFGLSNAKINGEKALTENNEFYMLARFTKAKIITNAFSQMMMLTNEKEYYPLIMDYHDVIIESAEKEIKENLELIEKLKTVKASKQEKQEFKTALEEQIAELRIAMIHRNEITNALKANTILNIVDEVKQTNNSHLYFSPNTQEFQS